MPNGPREKRKDSVEIPKRVKYNEKLANEIVELEGERVRKILWVTLR